MLEGFIGHHRAEVGASNANVDKITDRFAGVPLPGPTPNAIGKISHPVENRMHFRHHIPVVHEHGLTPGGAQSYVQGGAIFGEINLIPAEHRFNAFGQSGFPRQLQEKFNRFVRDTILGIVQEPSCGFGI